MEQLIILVLIGLVSFINWLIKKSGEARAAKKLKEIQDRGGASYQVPDQRDQQNRPVADESADAMRKFMEALGLPADQEQAPPPIPERRITLDPEVFAPQPPPPRPVVRREPEPVFTPPPIPDFIPPIPTVPVISVPEWREEGPAVTAPVHSWDEPAEEKRAPSRAAEFLSSRGRLRDAIVIAEVLGPPRALRPLEQ